MNGKLNVAGVKSLGRCKESFSGVANARQDSSNSHECNSELNDYRKNNRTNVVNKEMRLMKYQLSSNF